MQAPNRNKPPPRQQPAGQTTTDKWTFKKADGAAISFSVQFNAQRGANLVEALSLKYADAIDYKSVWVDANTRDVVNLTGQSVGQLHR
jgi:hypothetical protein